jgi:hypothetical protein
MMRGEQSTKEEVSVTPLGTPEETDDRENRMGQVELEMSSAAPDRKSVMPGLADNGNVGGECPTFDLHGYSLSEARQFVKKMTNKFKRQRRVKMVSWITGKGKNSRGRRPVLRPEILQLLRNMGVPAAVKPSNRGIVEADMTSWWQPDGYLRNDGFEQRDRR